MKLREALAEEYYILFVLEPGNTQTRCASAYLHVSEVIYVQQNAYCGDSHHTGFHSKKALGR